MNRLEFLQGLKAELEGRVPHSIIQENLRYYDSYISDEAAKGQSEEDVVESLGGPRIIARTIVDAALDTEDRLPLMRDREAMARGKAGRPTVSRQTPMCTMWTSASGM